MNVEALERMGVGLETYDLLFRRCLNEVQTR